MTGSPSDDAACREQWARLEAEAIARGEDFYRDPLSGYWVATSEALRRRGPCCETGCRHCPYGFRGKPG